MANPLEEIPNNLPHKPANLLSDEASQGHLQRPKGTQDVLPHESAKWGWIEETARCYFQAAAYEEIRTPIFEVTELFERGVGEDTDIVNKEMYTFEKDNRKMTLRPEGTAGIVRAYIENGLSRSPKPLKLFYSGPMFRYERPQAGRQRQFHQFGIEVFGLDRPEADAEVILLAMGFFKTLQLPALSLEINNIGTPESRQVFKQKLQALTQPHLAQLCDACRRRYHTNTLRMLDCKVDTCKAIYALPEIEAFLSEDHSDAVSRDHFETLKAILNHLEIPYRRNSRLVRGLDYYTRTVFEITSTHLGAQNAVCGGGRYNNLVEELGGPPTPAVGWALGWERLVSLVPGFPNRENDYYLVTDQPAHAFSVAEKIRRAGKSAEVDLSGKAFSKQMAQAGRRGAAYALILGETEVSTGTVTVKNLKTAEQTILPQDQFLSGLRS